MGICNISQWKIIKKISFYVDFMMFFSYSQLIHICALSYPQLCITYKNTLKINVFYVNIICIRVWICMWDKKLFTIMHKCAKSYTHFSSTKFVYNSKNVGIYAYFDVRNYVNKLCVIFFFFILCTFSSIIDMERRWIYEQFDIYVAKDTRYL